MRFLKAGVGVMAAAWWGVGLAGEVSPPALVGGKPITMSELDARFADQSAQRERNYAAQVQRARLQHERDTDQREGLSTSDMEKLKALEKEKTKLIEDKARTIDLEKQKLSQLHRIDID